MKSFLSIILLTVISLGELVNAQDPLNGYLEKAARNNPGVQATYNAYLAALELIPQVSSLPDPNLAFAFFLRPVETRMGPQRSIISISQMFPWFGTLSAKESQQAEMARAKYEEFKEALARLNNKVRTNYFDLYLLERSIEILADNLNLLETFSNLVLIKIESGKASAVDEYRIKMEIGDLENQLALMKDKHFSQVIRFNNLLNSDTKTPPMVPIVLWEDDFDFSKSEVIDSVMTQNHQVLKLQMQSNSLDYKRDLAKLANRPAFNIGIDYIAIAKGANDLPGKDAIIFPKIGLSIPLYQDKYKAMVEEVNFLSSAKNLEQQELKNFLVSRFENSYKAYLDADRRIDLYKSQVDLSNQAINLLEAEYATSSLDFAEVLRMERKKLQYAVELERARADKQASISFIRYLMGN